MRCNKCRKELRPRKTKKADHPGTIEHYGQGYCKTCWGVVRPERERTFRPRNCASCDRPMRAKDSKIADFPGTVSHRAHGKCQTCVRPGGAKVKVEAGKPLEEITDPGVLKLMQDRKARAVKQERIRQVRIQQEQARARFIASRRQAA